jgi:hypothetical protein
MTSGIYLFGSALVYIWLIWEGQPYPLTLVLPPLVGIAIGISFPAWLLGGQTRLLKRDVIIPDPTNTTPSRNSVLPVIMQLGNIDLETISIQKPDF